MNEAKHTPQSETRYIVPPGINLDFHLFLDHLQAAGDSPIMIVGPTGAGKSLYLHVFKRKFENDHKIRNENTENQDSKKKKPQVVWANCAHFGGVHSDPNIARAEIFGQKKGSHATAYEEKEGLVDKANGGALILEEIGELPREVQAMLLTFVESGEYRPVGGEKTKTAKVRIVGATNREKALRKDLRYRFFPFYVPALYERRDTILYYMYEKFPDVVTDLTRSQVLALLAYNWPGNVREIDRVARLIKRSKSEDERTKFESPSEKRRFESRYLHYLDPRYTSLRGELGDRILDDVSKLGKGDIKLLESLLGRFNVGLSSESTEPVLINAPKVYDFEKTVQWDEREKIREEFGVEMMPSIKPFEDAFQGYLAYCGLFMRHPMEEANSMEDLDKASLHFLSLDELHLTEEEKVKVEELVKSIMLSIRFVDIKGHVMPEDLFQYWDALGRLKEETEEREEELSWTEADREYLMDHLAAMTPDEARRLHLQSLLWKTGGVKRKAASLAGMAPSTFKDQVRKFRAGEKKD